MFTRPGIPSFRGKKTRGWREQPPFEPWSAYSLFLVDGHPIHNKDPKKKVIINPYEPLDD